MDLASNVRADVAFVERYTLGEKLGEGGMGTVYRAVQRTLNRPVAVKFMNPSLSVEQSYRDRFFAEAQLAAGLIHSHVTAVFDFGVAAGVHYLVTELVTGKALDFLIAQPGGVDPRTALLICSQVLAGLEGIHSLGIIHRDLKPANIIVVQQGSAHAKILDFGIAKQLSGANGPKTAIGVVLGSPAYMSPEQAAGELLGPSSDLYSLTLIVFQLITGKIPFQGAAPMEMFRRKRTEDPAIPTNLVGALGALVRRGLARKAADRYPDARTYRVALEAATTEVNHVGSFFVGAPAPTFEPAAGAGPARGAGLAGLRPGSAPDVRPVVPPVAAKPVLFPTIAGMPAAPGAGATTVAYNIEPARVVAQATLIDMRAVVPQVRIPSAPSRPPGPHPAPESFARPAPQPPLEKDDAGRTVLVAALVVFVIGAALMVPEIHDRVFPRRAPAPSATASPAP